MITKEFVLAGRAVFTVENASGEYYTFRVGHKEANGQWPETWFLSLLTGRDNENDYTYLGILTPSGEIKLTRKSPFQADAKPIKVASWAIRQVWSQNQLPEGYKIRHEGKCCRCGRTLSTPESLNSGWGPECRKKINAA